MIPLAAALRQQQRHVTIETAGTLYLPVECDLMSISPKLANSKPGSDLSSRWIERHERARHAPSVVRRLIRDYPYQIKFVVDQPYDCEEVEAYLAEFPEIDRARTMLMPLGTDPQVLARQAEWLEPYCVQHGLQFCPRKQIEWFGFTRGT